MDVAAAAEGHASAGQSGEGVIERRKRSDPGSGSPAVGYNGPERPPSKRARTSTSTGLPRQDGISGEVLEIMTCYQ